MNPILDNAAGSVIAAAVVALTTYLSSSRLRSYIRRKLRGIHLPDSKDTIRQIIRFLEDDQDDSGRFMGQFGHSASVAEESKFQTGSERLDTKPRLYLTGWPVFIFSKHHLEKSAVKAMIQAARTGVLALIDYNWVRVGVGATQFTNPLKPNSEISYRHTIRAAQILQTIDGDAPVTRAVLGRMLDPHADIQAGSGGWRQCNDQHRAEDLWASAYAVGLLTATLADASRLALADGLVVQVRDSLNRTLDWLTQQWEKDNWRYGEASTEENAPILFHECAAAFNQFRPEFSQVIIRTFDSWLDPVGHPTAPYLTAVENDFSAAIRLCYAYFLTRNLSTAINSSFDILSSWLRQQPFTACNSADASMLLDMLLTGEQSPKLPDAKDL
ncbi:hypothetical protein [Methyloglobulus sp.]|uniref:hypothetical protein n=1 Tax=Methyloglobulus sp. TaxID=2518622 RepID=UPI003989CC67